jgi:hypothetical protein
MKKTIYLFFVSLMLISITATAQVTNTVTFQADMSALIAEGFDPATDTVEVQGLNWDNGTDVTVTGDRFMTLDGSTASVTLTIATTSALAAGDSLRWKFHGYPDANFDPSWEGDFDNTEWQGRSLILQADGATFTDGPHVPDLGMFAAGIANTVIFKADLTSLLGTGSGFFDPAIDGIEVRGFWSGDGADAEATVIDGSTGPMVRNLDPGVVYETTATIQLAAGLEAGTITRWKFKTFPDERWADGGWELGIGNLYTFLPDGSTTTESLVPNVVPLQGPLGKDVDVLFQCFIPENALSAVDSSAIPREQVEFVILKGDNPAIGSWAGDWAATDTVDQGAIALYDNGSNGDIAAGDFIFSRVVTFADTISGGGVTYKYGAQYPGLSGTTPLDNYAGFGQNETFVLEAVDTTVVLFNTWRTLDPNVSVEDLGGQLPSDYTLDQNYPNPFNPSTKIRYSVPAESEVTLKIFDLLGREIATLVDSKQAAGNYEATFDAAGLSTGIYFYRMDAGGVSISKKMMFVK